MSNKLSSVIYQYRHYKADQVLTHTQLNETIAYFEDQDRLTRMALFGVGILHGLQIELDESSETTQLIIRQGVGITTDGDLILLHQALTETQPKEKNIGIDQLIFTHFREYEDANARYSPYFFPEEGQVPLWEMCQENDENAQSLDSLPDWQDKILLAYLECYPKPQDICGDINCDNQGEEQVTRLRILMMNEGDVEQLVSHDPLFLRKRQIDNAVSALSPLQLLKVVHQESNTSSQLQIDRLYRDAILDGNTIADLKSGIQTILNEFEFLFEDSVLITALREDLDTLLDAVFNFEQDAAYQYNQYRYLLAKDLVGTYNELLAELKIFNSWPNPDIAAFPKHLLFGKISDASFRHAFFPSPSLGSGTEQLELINSLLKKTYYLLVSFGISGGEGLRIIPNGNSSSNSRFPSIPFFYQNNQGLTAHWRFKGNPLIFRYDIGSNPLLMEYSGLDSYWIGGHLGADGEQTYQSLLSMVKQFGLEFKVYHFDLSATDGKLKKFLQSHPSSISMGGVAKSGTYILLSYQNQVFGDLSLSYRVVDEIRQSDHSHVRVAACSYPWISTLKYLNNLSRSLKGSRRNSGVQPESYLLVIRDYEINGQPMISGPVTLAIPLENIFNRRMHAITESLNERFPKGLVFDYDESLKRFLITRPYDDEFTVSFADTTLNINSPVYTYTQDGMEKTDQTFRLDAIRCEEKRLYRESTYMQLQNEFAPTNKDDDYGAYKGKWQEWYSLIERLKTDARFTGTNNPPRIPQSYEDLPASLRRIIGPIRNELTGSGVSHQLYLTGDWMNGSWASIEMIDDYKNTTNTNDLIFRFLNLRSKLHEKEQATKASLFVVLTNESNRAEIENLMEPWTDKADIYIEGPQVRGRRRIIDGITEKLRL
ncbi:hypothetical protein [Cyclobacterium plantarum]|uniref:Uncharacterized protein n=1 Tax=Cyclobacterium plantarum TaxID=2716263 RepID=A0ABX0H770_9BACT|nr:hypothetical protein [Cyclobacterium plantarum]NHE57489.1 hypothetical protein [Cyclobacterium plantarum]